MAAPTSILMQLCPSLDTPIKPCKMRCVVLGTWWTGPALPRFPCVAASRAAGCSRGRHSFGTSSSVGGRHINSLHLDIARG
ncbi:hypothetical protein CH063_01473, partial [Colletotrichum higginsianum]